MAKTKNQAVGEKRRSPEWVQNVKDFFKMVFISPFALLARIAQRIALGKEGAQKADEMAEAAYKASNERRAAEKVADHMNKEVGHLLDQKNKDTEYRQNPLNIKACKIYIPDNGRNDLQFAIDVHCQNQTEYNHSRDFALYVDKDGELVCNKAVPTEIVKQVEVLLEHIKLTQRNTEAEVSQEVEPPQPIPTPVEQPIESERPAPTTTPVTQDIIQTTERPGEDGFKYLDVSCGDNAVTVHFKPGSTTANVMYTSGNDKYQITAEYTNHAIRLSGNEPHALNAISAADYGLINAAMHKAFSKIIELDHSTGCPINGAICENVAQELCATAKAGMPSVHGSSETHRIYIIPDSLAARDVVMKVECTPNNFYAHTGYLDEQHMFVQREVDSGVKVDAKSSVHDITRSLAGNYMYAADYQGTPFLQGAISSNRRVTFYLGHEHNDKYHAAAIEEQHGALLVRSDAPVNYDALAQCSRIETPSLADAHRREEALNKVAHVLTQSNPQHIYGIIGNVIVERNENELIGHLSGYPEAEYTVSFTDKAEIRATLDNVTQYLENKMQSFIQEENDSLDQNSLDNDEFDK